MTCIVGLVDNGKVYIGGDSAGVSGYSLQIRSDQKVFKNGGFVFGFCGSFRMGNLLNYSFEVPKVPNDSDLMRYMCTDFIDAVRTCLKTGGYANVASGVETGGTFLVGGYGRLFSVYSDFQVAECSVDYNACGCGEDLALGSLYTTSFLKKSNPTKRIKTALDAASFHSSGVSGPYKIMSA